MHDVEFLPAWYGKTMRRRRALWRQAVATGVVAAGLGLWLAADFGRAVAAEVRLGSLGQSLALTRAQLDELSGLRAERATLAGRERVLDELGASVDPAALLSELARIAPPGLTVLDFWLSTEERLRAPLAAAPRGRSTRGRSAASDAPVERWLRVRITAVAAGDLDVADFFLALSGVPFLRDAQIRRSDEKVYAGRQAREFEIEFRILVN